MAATQVQYRYALNDQGTLMNVDSLNSENRAEFSNFTCLGCSNSLIAVLGEKRAKHFRHKVTVDCSFETYLHNTAKRLIKEMFEECLEYQTPLIFTREALETCSFTKHNLTCSRPYYPELDLTKHFDQAELEAPINGYRADILLQSQIHKKQLLIEVVVTHKCDEQKRTSGLAIVEVDIFDEDSIDSLFERNKQGVYFQTPPRLYGFDKKPRRLDLCSGKGCAAMHKKISKYEEKQRKAREVYILALYKSGKVFMGVKDKNDLAKIKKQVQHLEVLGKRHEVEHNRSKLYGRKVEQLHFDEQFNVKSCFICRHRDTISRSHGFCRRDYKRIEKMTQAYDCPGYSPFSNREEKDEAKRTDIELRREWKRSRIKTNWLRNGRF